MSCLVFGMIALSGSCIMEPGSRDCKGVGGGRAFAVEWGGVFGFMGSTEDFVG